ncbi:hypothetical protein COO60DRAFT_1524487 [Scenedesmus sp. NREL 46B-D3]|nr:hypothetical protein COO60DRAFT_1524487 [Scenedesmus sp. NREL 46B-D3]
MHCMAVDSVCRTITAHADWAQRRAQQRGSGACRRTALAVFQLLASGSCTARAPVGRPSPAHHPLLPVWVAALRCCCAMCCGCISRSVSLVSSLFVSLSVCCFVCASVSVAVAVSLTVCVRACVRGPSSGAGHAVMPRPCVTAQALCPCSDLGCRL